MTYQLITKTVTWEMGHRLMNHQGLCKNLHGHSYKADISIECPPPEDSNQQGMMIDMGEWKKIITKTIEQLDHAFMVNAKDTIMVEFLKDNNFKMVVTHREPTAENIIRWVMEDIVENLPPEIYNRVKKWYQENSSYMIDIHIRLWETSSNSVEWRQSWMI